MRTHVAQAQERAWPTAAGNCCSHAARRFAARSRRDCAPPRLAYCARWCGVAMLFATGKHLLQTTPPSRMGHAATAPAPLLSPRSGGCLRQSPLLEGSVVPLPPARSSLPMRSCYEALPPSADYAASNHGRFHRSQAEQCSASGDIGTQVDSHGCMGPDSSSTVDLELHHNFLQPPELLALQARAAAVPESDWRPCSFRVEATAAGPAKECTHVIFGQDPVAAGVLRRLALLTDSSTAPLETLPLVRYRPGSEATPLHVDHLPDGARVGR